MAEVLISERARDELEALDSEIRERIKSKLLDEVADQPDRHLVRLSGSERYRVRVGAYRVIIQWEKADNVLKITKIDKRDRVYDR